ncbi:MAG TPA: hypothetical protein VJ939_02415, partial [Bacteroidales bacterium]|nr:hypothetical protein [Bacteroidales bacterium]
MKTKHLILTTSLLLGFLLTNIHTEAQGQELTAEEVVEKADQKFRGESSEGIMRMSIVRPKWERTIEMKSWSLGTEYFMV